MLYNGWGYDVVKYKKRRKSKIRMIEIKREKSIDKENKDDYSKSISNIFK